VQALRRPDLAEAQEVLTNHLDDAETRLRRMFSKPGSPTPVINSSTSDSVE
jgi:DNA-binding GntR family transcriptional regulator